MPNPAADNGPAPFTASANGLPYTNSWPKQAAVTVPTPFGQVAVGDASKGLCGGMVFAALDYWHAGAAPPAERPGPDDPAYGFVVKRLVDSWNVPAGIAQYYQWMNLPDQDRDFSVLGHRVVGEHGLSWRTLTVQWPEVRADLDHGVPSPLGLVTVKSANPNDLSYNHQVLAWAYEEAGGVVTVKVYDPNSGGRDDVTISFPTASPTGPTAFTHTINIGHPVRGFFRTAYQPAEPPA